MPIDEPKEPMTYVPVLIPPSILERIEAWRRAQPGSAGLTRSHALRALVEIGLKAEEKRGSRNDRRR